MADDRPQVRNDACLRGQLMFAIRPIDAPNP
jgi:hypothetical protein